MDFRVKKNKGKMVTPTAPAGATTMDSSAAIADAKVPPGEDYEEIREQVCLLCFKKN